MNRIHIRTTLAIGALIVCATGARLIAADDLPKGAAVLDKYVEVTMRGTGSSLAVIKESIPRGKLEYKLYDKEAKALLRMVFDAKLTQIDTSGAVDKQFDYSLLTEAAGKPKSQLGGE